MFLNNKLGYVLIGVFATILCIRGHISTYLKAGYPLYLAVRFTIGRGIQIATVYNLRSELLVGAPYGRGQNRFFL